MMIMIKWGAVVRGSDGILETLERGSPSILPFPLSVTES